MDYFKHYSTASSSNLISHLFEEMGHQGYACWFLLLELCAENWDGESEPEFRFHTRIVRQKLRVSQTKLEVFLGFCSGFSDLSFDFSENFLSVAIPKLMEVKTSRKVIKSNKKLLPVYKEIDIERDTDTESLRELSQIESPQEKLKIISSEKFTPDHFVDLWNSCFGAKLSFCHGLGAGVHLKNFLESLQWLPTEKHWRDLFQACMSSPKCMGQNSISWSITPTWIVNYDNALKVLNGDFDDDKAVKQLFAAMEQGDAV